MSCTCTLDTISEKASWCVVSTELLYEFLGFGFTLPL